jgi:hypothetical protein
MCGARAAVEAIGAGVEFILTVDREVGALGQILAQQGVGVLAGATLPGGEVRRNRLSRRSLR